MFRPFFCSYVAFTGVPSFSSATEDCWQSRRTGVDGSTHSFTPLTSIPRAVLLESICVIWPSTRCIWPWPWTASAPLPLPVPPGVPTALDGGSDFSACASAEAGQSIVCLMSELLPDCDGVAAACADAPAAVPAAAPDGGVALEDAASFDDGLVLEAVAPVDDGVVVDDVVLDDEVVLDGEVVLDDVLPDGA